MTQSDQNIRNLSKIFYNSVKAIDEDELLDHSHLSQFKKEKIKPLYPLKSTIDGPRKYYCCEACCESPGYLYCCFSKNGDKQFESLGLSVNLYFKFLKHFLVFFLFMSTLAILSCVVCYKVAQQNDIDPLSGYSTFLFSTTYGAFSSQTDKCHYGLLKKGIDNYEATFDIVCQAGIIKELGVVLSDESLNSTYNCRKQSKKIGGQADKAEKNSRTLPLSTPFCPQEKSCSFSLKYLLTIDSNTYNTVSYIYECTDNQYYIGQLNLSSEDYFRFIVGIDLFIFLWIILFFFCNSKAEQTQRSYFKKKQLSLDDFSIKIKGFQYNTAQNQLQGFFAWLKKKNQYKQIQTMVSAYTFTQSKRMLEYYDDKDTIFNQAYKLIRQYFFDSQAKKNLSFEQSYAHTFEGAEGYQRYKEYKQKLSALTKNILIFLKDRLQIENESRDNTTALIVFSKMQTKKKIMKEFQSSCCSKNMISLNGKIYISSDPPVPDMFILENKYSWTKIRVLFSWVLTLVICAGSYLLFGYIQLKQNQLFTDYNYGIDCKVLYSSSDLTIINTSLLSQDNYVTCICKDNALKSLSSGSSDYCTTWSKKYALYLIVPLLISFGIVIYNVIVSQLFRLLSRFQKHKFVIDEQISYTFKRAFLLILNMGLIMILLNFNYKRSLSLSEISFIFLGRYEDFTVDWYENIGSIIILTMIFNIATPITEFFLSFIAKCFKKCWDTKCCRLATSKYTKQQYIEMYSDDIFPIGQRYAYLISTFFITFSFCGVIPILIPVCCLSFFLLYTTDKILIFKVYQKPMNYTQNLHNILHNILLISLLSHFALTAYFLTEPSLIAPNNTSQPNLQFSSDERLYAMIRVYYIYPYLGFIALIIIWILLKLVFGSLISCLTDLCATSQKSDDDAIKSYMVRDLSIQNTLSRQQAQALNELYEYNLKKYSLKYSSEGQLKKVMQSLYNQQTKSKIKQTPILASIIKRSKQTINTSLAKLREQDMSISGIGSRLLGVPSYDYLIINKKVTRNQQMMAIEQKLLSFYKPKGALNQTPNQTIQTSVQQPNLSAENLNKGETI